MKPFAHILFILCLAHICTGQPESYDIEIGQAYRQQVESQVGLYEDEELTEWVNSVGERLVDELGEQPFEYSFEILDSEETNAFALPGGPTYVTRGLLALVNDESELAGVMAHEIIHVHRRHAIQQMNGSGILKDLFRLPGQVVGMFNSSLGSLLQLPVDLGSDLFDANYSRSHEKEADRLGIQLAHAAGYDPYALADILESIGEETVYLTGQKEKRRLTNDHPVTKKRLKYLDRDLDKYFGEIAPVQSRQIDILDGMVYGVNPKQGVFVKSVFMQPDIMLHWTVPDAWETINTPATVGAMEMNGEGFVMISLADQSMTPRRYADTVAAMFESRPDLIQANEPVSIGGFDGHSVLLVANKDKTPLYLRLVWLNFDDLLIELAAYGIAIHAAEMERSLESLRYLTDSERAGITVDRLAIVETEEGETLAEVAARMDNVVEMKTLELLNGVDKTHPFGKGEPVKIVVSTVY